MDQLRGAWTLAIDFGTSNTAAALRPDRGPARPVRLSDQADQMPSAVLGTGTGLIVGVEAVRAARIDPSAFEATPKRRIAEQEVLLGDREVRGVALAAAVLQRVRLRAGQTSGGAPLRQVLLTHPEHWSGVRQAALVEAAVAAGFDPDLLRLVTEPVAAASRYAAAEPVRPGGHVAVFDWGGGTCDVAVLRAGTQPGEPFQVIAAQGRDPLGGEDLDARLETWVLGQLAERGEDALLADLRDPEALGSRLSLRDQVRAAKHALSDYEYAQIPVSVGARQAVVTVTADEFDDVVTAEIEAAVALTRYTLERAGLQPSDLHELYLTGGSSHLRIVHRSLTDLLGRPPATLDDPKLVVALGALDVPDGVVDPQAARTTALRPAPTPAPTPASPPPPPGRSATATSGGAGARPSSAGVTRPLPASPPAGTDRARTAPSSPGGARPAGSVPPPPPGLPSGRTGAPDPQRTVPRGLEDTVRVPPPPRLPPAPPPRGPGGSTGSAPAGPPRRRRTGRTVGIVLAVVGVLAVGGGAAAATLLRGGDDPQAGPEPSASTSRTPRSSPSARPSPTPSATGAEPASCALTLSQCGLVERLPSDYVDTATCTALEPFEGQDVLLKCSVPPAAAEISDNPATVVYPALFSSPAALSRYVDGIATAQSLEVTDDVPGRTDWRDGDRLTFVAEGYARTLWTYDADLLVLEAVGGTQDTTSLNDWWLSDELDPDLR